MASLKVPALVLAAVISSGMAISEASALPASGLAPAAKQITDGVQDVRWVCGPYRCWWRPGPYYGRYYYGRPYWRRGWGWRRRYW